MRLRLAVPSDAAAVARVHVRSWQAGYRGLLQDSFLDGLDAASWARTYTFDVTEPMTVLAVQGESIVGFVTTSTAAEPCLLMALYVDPDHWRAGIGRQLMSDALARFQELDRRAAELWVLDGNRRADRFYRAHGWQPDGRRRSETVRGVGVTEIGYTIAVN
ncbi:GNAT family N-acetyltransferase [Antrihabitans cavernicola]|uniref:GNAT family N-acetyltransferase n=1 Tax=Antrihabitans cavernicola TaxID=2495913 RepID=A0A5A7SET6_9NOCA|nr:GNAT family N-acetyltransferase [Spelaeibacter cavernicola]